MRGDRHQPPAADGHFCVQVGTLVLKKAALRGGSLRSVVLSQGSGCAVATSPPPCSLCPHCREGLVN